jgi:CRP/FNR family cyclic AMP-dependent transcriptional regulator
MISLELIRRYPFFAGLSHSQIETLAHVADEMSVPAEHYFFHEGDELNHFYLAVEGEVVVVIGLPKKGVTHKLSELLTYEFQTNDVIVITIGLGDIFGWSALIPPYKATSGGKTLTPCRVIAFDCRQLRQSFEEDFQFGYLMTQKAAQVIRSRLRQLRTESLVLSG